MAGEQAGVFGAGKAVIQQKHHAPVFLRADDPARRLQHLVHARKAVGVVETGAARLVIVAAPGSPAGGSPEATYPHDGAPEEPVAHQIHTLAKDAAHDPEAQQRFCGAWAELFQKGRPGRVV